MDKNESTASPSAIPRISSDRSLRNRYRGCLLGGAVGDALGAHVEFKSLRAILSEFGEPGIRDYAPTYGRHGAITDDTQMTLYTAEAMLRAHTRMKDRGIGPAFDSMAAGAYLRWLRTQGIGSPLPHDGELDGWLSTHKALFDRRAPGNTCLSALRAMTAVGEMATNDSKGCGGVMRAAPVGMYTAHWIDETHRPEHVAETFRIGSAIAAITHGHSTGHLTAGVLAVVVALLLKDTPLISALDAAVAELRRHPHHEETLNAIEHARALARQRPAERAALIELGEGWIAEEALAMSLYCALGATNFESGIILAVNHSGDSDSTGAITGNLLGATWGEAAIPQRWLADLELREVIGAVADDLASLPDWQIGPYADELSETEFYFDRYPPY